MGKKNDINQGAMAAVGVLALAAGVATGSIWVFLGTAVVFGRALKGLGIVR